jgi:hypothetical protein
MLDSNIGNFVLAVKELENCIGQLFVGCATLVAHLFTPRVVGESALGKFSRVAVLLITSSNEVP